jgi:hypothetical protein
MLSIDATTTPDNTIAMHATNITHLRQDPATPRIQDLMSSMR